MSPDLGIGAAAAQAPTKADQARTLSVRARNFLYLQKERSEFIQRVFDGQELLTPQALEKVNGYFMVVKQSHEVALRSLRELIELLRSISASDAGGISCHAAEADEAQARLDFQQTTTAVYRIRSWGNHE